MTGTGVQIGAIGLKNPVIAAPGEHLIDDAGLLAAIATGAGAVVMKSTNESQPAKRQLRQAEYAALSADWTPAPWGPEAPADAALLTRSGLHPLGFGDWLEQARRIGAAARAENCLLVPSIILADLDQAVDHARAIEQAGLPVVELNIGTPYASQAARGAVSTELDPERIGQIVGAVAGAVSIPVWVKLSGQSERVPQLVAAAAQAGAASAIVAGRALGMLPDLDTMRPHLGTSCGYGGPWNLPLTCHWLAETRALLGPDFPLIGINGATSGSDVLRMMLAGATAVGLSSQVMLRGWPVLADAVRDVQAYCTARNLPARDLIGRAADARLRFSDMPELDDQWRHHIPATPARITP